MDQCPECGADLKVTKTGILVCTKCKYEYRSDWLGGENIRYMCPICRTSNDPKVFAMKKINGRWYHKICLQTAMHYFLNHFDFRLTPKLDFMHCKPKAKVTQKQSKVLNTIKNADEKIKNSRSERLHNHKYVG